MPEPGVALALDRVYSREEFERIALGVIPDEMEDHWFVFYEEPWLHLHRSWTGLAVFDVRFAVDAENIRIVEARTPQSDPPASGDQLTDLAGRLEDLLDALSRRAPKS